MSGADTVTVEAGGKLSVTRGAAINWTGVSTDLKITNSGMLESLSRAIDATGSDNARTLTLKNKKGGYIRARDNDAVRIDVNPTAGVITVNNAGTINATGRKALNLPARIRERGAGRAAGVRRRGRHWIGTCR
ncbi:hypothetical protein SAMN02799622_02955 [Methylobacterium sp. UNC378MF]|uniref:hypothetical protein n=1 Tax=Methylobacterium sp. UNC378MF TaxID=1502748 RepID=UPI00088E9B59|nr:hypothetical protein [Methylobacterium sp. UNC378MF]SDA22527.1 hypothetical protein SAMN02799622_02955 [Methylobacterium sp. UNC378MF]